MSRRKKPPKHLLLRAFMFGDGARGGKLQLYANEEWHIFCSATLANRNARWRNEWTSDATGEVRFSTYKELRAAWPAKKPISA